ncbi:thymidine phosphorylase [Peredibacter starrii]|uniref:thymidine phosphorylase n=1 Tax=Peredibacter starrii TaxID=28202 RepID=A0AAX4HML7_9BACT|nr:thymidine phosphorylase [Peredibacter starrii]WPU64440.1 thymidine phosphorylase [Peredibacter starrii]
MTNENFQVYPLIDKKKRGERLTNKEIKWFIQSYTDGKLPDYQMSAMLMAMFIKGMDVSETAYLTDAMLESGKQLKFPGKNVIDKHSTGGIGDKASFVLAPIASAAGVKVPMIAGRGLGHTGGTVDKVEAIKGFSTALDLDTFSQKLNKEGLVLIGQTPEIAPADRLIYALRDVTATIDSIPLITASIMSKKLAEGANGIVFDIKCGTGAFMRTPKDARNLGKSLIATSKRFKKKAVALITDMNQPLGNTVGHSHEIIESIETLKGNGPKDLTDISIALAAHMIHIAGVEKTFEKAHKKALEMVSSGKALEEFRKLIKSQDGDDRVIDDYSILPLASAETQVLAPKTGFIKMFQNEQIGLLLIELGGGRKTKADLIDHSVGFTFHKKIGDKVKKGEPIFTIHHHPHQQPIVEKIKAQFVKEVLTMSSTKVKAPKLIIEKLS